MSEKTNHMLAVYLPASFDIQPFDPVQEYKEMLDEKFEEFFKRMDALICETYLNQRGTNDKSAGN